MPLTGKARPALSILVVEDEEDGANSLAELLGLFGYRVAVARTGTAALLAAEMDRPDVVLLDIRLPDIDGWEVARRMRDTATGGPQPVVVAITGSSTEADQWRSVDAGIDLHWVKPADPATLLATLARFAYLLDRRSARSDGAEGRDRPALPRSG
jgi:two-component system, OmpR family, response regulator